MEACLKQSSFKSYHIVYSQTISREESQEAIVPDRFPDIAGVITASGCALIRSKDVRAGCIRLEANVPAKVSCYSEAGEIFCMDVNLPLSVSAEDPVIPENGICSAGLTLAALEAKAVNPRKISVSAAVEFSLECYAQQEEFCFSAPETEDTCRLHTQEQETETYIVSGITEKTFVLTDEFILEPEQTPMVELLGHSTDFLLEDVKYAGTKLILRGSILSSVFYRSAEMQTDLVRFTTAFSQIVDLDCTGEAPDAEVRFLLSGAYYEISPGFDGRSLKTELHAVAQCILTTAQKRRCLTDAYSNAYQIELHRSRLEQCCSRRGIILREVLRERIDLPQGTEDVFACCISELGRCAEPHGAGLRLSVILFCRGADGRCLVLRRKAELHVKAELSENEKITVCAVQIGDESAAVSNGIAELRASVTMNCFAEQRTQQEYITGISYDESEPLDHSMEPSLVILRLSRTDDLWQLAKEYCSTVDAIRDANRLESGDDGEEKLILIPRAE